MKNKAAQGKKLRRMTAMTLAAVMAASITVTAFGAEPISKDESVYVNLKNDGTVDNIYVINSFETAAEVSFIDYGSYTNLRNLTTAQPLGIAGDSVSIDMPKGKFYYQGTLSSHEIPWTIGIGYTLDGAAVDGAALGGKSGHLQVMLTLSPAPNADAVYTDNFALQTSLQLDSEICHNIDAPDATIANVGGNRQLSYIILPGQSKTFTISADVVDFAMQPIQISGIPLKLSLEKPDTAEINDKVKELTDGTVELDDGAVKLNDGVVTLCDGVSELKDGVADLNDGTYELYDGTRDLCKGTEQLHGASQLVSGGVATLVGGLTQLSQSGTQLRDGFVALQEILPTLPPEQQAMLAPLVGGTIQYIDGVAAIATSASPLVQGTEQLSRGIGGVSDGANDMERGTRQLYEGTMDLKDGVDRLYDGVAELRDGTTELSDGTTQLRNESATMDTKVQDEIDKLMEQYTGGEFELTSFTSPRNGKVKNLQFVMKSEEIKRPEEVKAEVPEPASPDFLQRIINLFKPRQL